MACRRLDGENYNDYRVKVEEIPLRFHEIKGIIEGHIEAYRPSKIICTGQSGGPSIAVERVALNIADARIPYNCGLKPADKSLSKIGPAAYFSKLPYRRVVERLKQSGIPAVVSNSAGTFGCNQLFYHLMDYLARKEDNISAGFIHVPSLPEQVINRGVPSMTVELIAEAIKIAVETVVNCIQ
jgi:pyroglutamyl-peptidase